MAGTFFQTPMNLNLKQAYNLREPFITNFQFCWTYVLCLSSCLHSNVFFLTYRTWYWVVLKVQLV